MTKYISDLHINFLYGVETVLANQTEEIKNLRVAIEELNRKLSAIEEFCGLLYQEKYGIKPKRPDGLFDLEKDFVP